MHGSKSGTFRRRRRRRAGVGVLALVAGIAATMCGVSASPAAALVPSGVSTTPPMGFNSWYFFANGVTADNLAAEADAMAAPQSGLGGASLKSLGYTDVGIDGGWWLQSQSPNARDADGIVPGVHFFTAPIKATATSAQPGFSADAAHDGDPGTMWHTAWNSSGQPVSPVSASNPQSITLDMRAAHTVDAVTYVPRSDSSTNGIITAYNVYTSTDGATYTKVVSGGTWANDSTTKIAKFPATSARYVRLEATAGDGGFASAVEVMPDVVKTAASSTVATGGSSVTYDLGVSDGVGDTVPVPVDAVSYQSQSGETVTGFAVDASTDGVTYHQVATGAPGGTVNLPAQLARYVRLVATGGAFGTGTGSGGTVQGEAAGTYLSMNQLTAHVHSQGLRAGIYTDTGSTGCGGQWGSGGHESADTTQFANWGFDYAKIDHCGGDAGYPTAQSDYLAWGSHLSSATTSGGVSHPMSLEICEWGAEDPDGPWMWGGAAGSTWRTGNDITGSYGGDLTAGMTKINWSQVTNNFALNDHPSNAGPGQHNDPDYLLLGTGFGGNLTTNEKQSYFGMWAIQSAPLRVETDLADIDSTTLGIIGNSAVIAVDQDSASSQAQKIIDTGTVQVWSKKLSASGSRAVLVLNTGASSTTYNFTLSGTDLMGTPSSVKELYSGTDDTSAFNTSESLSLTLASHQSVLLQITGAGEQRPETVFVRDSSGNLQQRTWNGSSWSSWSPLSLGVAGSTGPGSFQGSPAVVSSPSGTDVFVRGGDNHVWENTYTGDTGSGFPGWTGWVNLGGSVATSPTAASLGQDRIDVFAQGTDGALWQNTYEQVSNGTGGGIITPGLAWGGWKSLGGPTGSTFTGTPSAVASLNRIDLFVRGTDNALYQRSLVNNTWTGWTGLGGTLTGAPAAASAGPGQVDVFITQANQGADNVYEKQWTTAAGWSGSWASLGSQNVTGGGLAAAESGSRVNVYAQGTDNHLWQWYYTRSGGAWQQLDSTLTLDANSSPAAAAPSSSDARAVTCPPKRQGTASGPRSCQERAHPRPHCC
ncbi:hypothetical protein ABH926_000926 [Catenulispora sp. GP43]|uniref:discoidin domain-containing protein n=1 Tax=Catenulispora sp. GP43 TaxID=3156263 RepID=UPI0035152216